MAPFLGLGAGGLAGGLAVAATKTASMGKELSKLSSQTGASVNELSKMQAVGSQLSIDQDDLTGSIEELNIRLGETVRDGTGPAAEAFKQLGLDAQQLADMPLTERFGTISDALNGLQDQAQKSFLADEIFGGDAFRIMPAIQQGSDGMDQLISKGEKLGLVMGDEQARSGQQFMQTLNTLKSGATGIFREIGSLILTTMDFGEGTASLTDFVAKVRGGIKSVTPLFEQYRNVAMAAWETVSAGATALWNAIGMGGSNTFGQIKNNVFDFLATMEFVWQNIPELAAFAWEKTKLGAVSLFNDIKFFFTDQLMPIVEWFSTNWRDIFKTIFDFTATVFINLGKNIRSAMSKIWKFIKSGGTSGLEFAWTPLTEGFKNTVKELPDVPERAMTEMEKQIKTRADRMGESLSSGLSAKIAERRGELLGDENLKTPGFEKVDTKAQAELGKMVGDAAAESANNKLGELEGPAAVQRDSADAFSAIFSAMRGEGQDKLLKNNEAQLKEQKSQTAALKKMAGGSKVELVAGTV